MDTIAAVSTAPGRGAIGVVRLSGAQAQGIVAALLGVEELALRPGQVTLRTLKPKGQDASLDQALLTFFAAPNSYTGEDVIEISCHGSPVVLRQLLDAILLFGGRLAEPGEFTLRAVSNGKINLSEAVAIRDLIDARTDAAAKQAVRQLQGELSLRMKDAKEKLIHSIVILESALEFVEDDLPRVQREELISTIVAVKDDLVQLAETFGVGHLLRDGFRVAIAGAPNVGKSSIFNKLVGFDRAIVTEIPGTTRDSLNEVITLGGIPVFLTDTAGVRESDDRIETLGVERSRSVIADADLVLLVIDGAAELVQSDLSSIVDSQTTWILVRNKKDLPSFRGDHHHLRSTITSVDVSALSDEGLDELQAAIIQSCGASDFPASSLMITDARHHDLLRRAGCELEISLERLNEGFSEELVVLSLHNALQYIGQITGETTSEDILTEIFSTFCIGK